MQSISILDEESFMKKRMFFGLALFLVLFVFACNGTGKKPENKKDETPQQQGGESQNPGQDEATPILKKIEVKTMDDASIFSNEKPNNPIDAGKTKEEKVKVVITVDSDVTVESLLQGAKKDEWTLSNIGENSLEIKLKRKVKTATYTLKLIREKNTPPTPPPAPQPETKELESLKIGFGNTTTLNDAKEPKVDASDSHVYNMEVSHTYSEWKYTLFVNGKNTENIVYIPSVTLTTPYPKADNKGIVAGSLPKAGGKSKCEFYLFASEADISDLSKGVKYTINFTVKNMPNTKIKNIAFNGKNGKIDGNNITCGDKFDIDTVINVVCTLEASTSTFKKTGMENYDELSEIRILASGAQFRILVTPQEGEAYRETYTVKLDANQQAPKAIVTGIRYYDGRGNSNTDLTETANREDDVFKVEHTEDEAFSFLPLPSENIEKVEMSPYTQYDAVRQISGIYILDARKANQKITSAGTKFRVTYKDGKVDEFTIKKK